MKRFVTAFLLLSSVAVHAQHPFDSYMRRRPSVSCQDILYNASDLVYKFYQERKTDSLYQFLDYWEERCGGMQQVIDLRTVLDLRTGNFDDTLDGQWIYQMLAYKGEPYLGRYPFPFTYRPYTTFPPYHDRFFALDSIRQLTRSIASETLANDPDQQLITDFYALDSPTFQHIRTAPSSSRLRSAWEEVYRETRRLPETHIALFTGMVQYHGNTSLFGDRPNLGMIFGSKTLRHNYDLILSVRIGPSRSPYTFQFQDSTVTHRDWTGLYVGGEYTFDFVYTPKLNIGLSGGLAYDQVTAIPHENDINEDENKLLGSFNKNGGLVIKYRVKEDGLYLGFHVRYNWANYHNPGGTPLDGEYVSLRLTVGSISNWTRARRLKNLQ